MPTYDYDCDTCGLFTAMQPMAAFRDPCACPACGIEAPRASLSAPGIAGMDPARRSALASSEQRASAPRRAPAAHPAGCGCCTRRWPLGNAPLSTGGRIFSSSVPPRST